MLAGGMVNSTCLKRLAERVGVLRDGKHKPSTTLITGEVFLNHHSDVRTISDLACEFYRSHQHLIVDCLKATAAGRRGVDPRNMVMQFWRYRRRALAIDVYRSGFFTDRVPEPGSITVFYDNDIKELRELLV